MEHLWVVPQSSSSIESLLPHLQLEAGVRIETFDTYGSLLKGVDDSPPATVVLAEAGPQNPGLLDLLVHLDNAKDAVPCIAVLPDGSGPDLPVEPSRSLKLMNRRDALLELLALNQGVLTPATPRRLVVDYLLLAILCRRSLALELTVATSSESLVEIVGGDIWNVYGPSSEAVEALEGILYESPSQAAVRALHTIPGERQLEHSGLYALSPTTRRLGRDDAGQSDGSALDFGTQEVETDEVRANVEKAQQVEAARGDSEPSAAAVGPSAESSGGDDSEVETLLTEGIQASLARNYTAAAAAFRRVLELSPGETRAAFNLGRIQKHLGS